MKLDWPHIKMTTVVAAALAVPMRRSVTESLALAARRWQNDPVATMYDIVFSGVGQVWFWTFGQDFLGFAMDPKRKPGLGHKLAPLIQERLPEEAWVAWTIKVLEIMSDATKISFEARSYRKIGLTFDAVACIIPQPQWSIIEVADKTAGVLRHPEKVNTPDQIADSISSIYGTWTRNFFTLVLFRYGLKWRNKMGHPQTIFA